MQIFSIFSIFLWAKSIVFVITMESTLSQLTDVLRDLTSDNEDCSLHLCTDLQNRDKSTFMAIFFDDFTISPIKNAKGILDNQIELLSDGNTSATLFVSSLNLESIDYTWIDHAQKKIILAINPHENERSSPIEENKPFVIYTADSHRYKAGKAWIAIATENWGVSGKFLDPYDTVKEGYITTKYFKLYDGRYLVEKVGTTKHPLRVRIEVKNGEIISEDSFTI